MSRQTSSGPLRQHGSPPPQRIVPAQRAWPAVLGDVPPLAPAFSSRPETGPGLVAELRPGQVTVLATAPGPGGSGRPSAGGEGKTQLAAALVRSLWQAGSVDLLVWLTAASRDAILAGYARGLVAVGAGDTHRDAGTAAARFMAWLAGTGRPWLVVLDDLTDPDDAAGLLPTGPSGSVLITTRLEPAALAGPGRRVIPVGPFSRREALGYLTTALSGYPDQRIEALDLAEDLQCLPLSLGLAAAVIIDRGLDCRGFRARFAERRIRQARPDGDDTDAAALTVSVGLDFLDQLPPAGLARGVLALACVLDPAGIPVSVLTGPAAVTFMTGERAGEAGVQLARTALTSLARLGLVMIDSGSAERTIGVHPVIGGIIRQLLPPPVFGEVARAAADALLEAWPQLDPAPPLTLALRDNTASLLRCTGDLLWGPKAHPLLMRAGDSLERGGLTGPAVHYWENMIKVSDRLLGPSHPQSLAARDRLAGAQEKAGLASDAISSRKRSLEERERMLGPGHPDSLTCRSHLAHAYLAAGQVTEAIPLYEQALAGREWALGPQHPDTLTARHDLASAYSSAGRLADATAIFERSLADQERALGSDHPDTLTARNSLAAAYRSAGRLKEAIPLYERNLAGRERVLGPDHPDTLTARNSLAAAYRSAGRLKEAIPLYERTLAGRERVLGPDHPDTLTARSSLAYAYRSAGKLRDSIPLYQRTLADRERVLGPDHPDTVASCGNLAATFYLAKRLKDAVPMYERTLRDCERVHGHDHPETLTAQGNLASAYMSARRLAEAIPMYERALADCERVLGADHADTLTARYNAGSAYLSARRQADAIGVFKRTLADCERVLGPSHQLTETVRESLAAISG
jgi:tetratricopeptide (TPR) repeat protein